MKARWRGAWWLVFIVGLAYFFLPLIGAFEFSLRQRPIGSAYVDALTDPQLYTSLLYSFTIGVVTIAASIGLLLPTAYWVRLKVPKMRPVVEFITLLPFVVPPIVLVFGLITVYSRPPLPLTGSNIGSDILLVCAYTVLSFPYMYRAIDTGMRTIDIRSLTEASQSLGAGWFTILVRVILPNLRTAILAGAFLTLAIVVGEFTIGSFLARHTFAVYLNLIGGNEPYQPAAVSLLAFGLTWIAMGAIALVGRGGRSEIQIAGTR